MSQLDSLRKHSLVVADSGDIDAVARWKPQDATTNPSLLLISSQDARYRHLLDADLDRMFVNFGREILKHVAGRVSTEVDARLSFDTDGSLAKARKLISLISAPPNWKFPSKSLRMASSKAGSISAGVRFVFGSIRRPVRRWPRPTSPRSWIFASNCR